MATWFNYAYAAIAILLIGVSVLLSLLAFFVALIEKQPVIMFRESQEPLLPHPYCHLMIHSAIAEHGFRLLMAGGHTKSKTVKAALLLSPDQRTIVIVGAGTIAKLPIKKTILITSLSDGGALLTVDKPGPGELDSRTHREMLLDKPFTDLWRLHSARVEDHLADVVSFGEAPTWAEVDVVYQARVQRMVDDGAARYADAPRTLFRYTASGAFRATILDSMRQLSAGLFAKPASPALSQPAVASDRDSNPRID